MKRTIRAFNLGAPIAVGLLASLGTLWAFTRGGKDFNVFYEAWRLVLSGWGAEIYKATPDRYLYAPGFAWALALFGFLPRDAALAVWCLGKALLFGMMLRAFAQKIGEPAAGVNPVAVVCAAVLLVARPLLIDLEYGQVNSIILCVAVLALLSHFDRRFPTFWDAVLWFALAMCAVAKIYAFPLLAVPWLATHNVLKRKINLERLGVILGFVIMVSLPGLSVGAGGWWDLMVHWRTALYERGMPTDSHNQSFAAFLHHLFSGEATHVIAGGAGSSVVLGPALLAPQTIAALTVGWTLGWAGFLWGWLESATEKAPIQWLAVAVGLLIVPSHLVWKPYFVLSYPLALAALQMTLRRAREVPRWPTWVPVGVLFVLMNFTGFDFVGRTLGAEFEAGSLLLFAHLALLVWIARSSALPAAAHH